MKNIIKWIKEMSLGNFAWALLMLTLNGTIFLNLAIEKLR